MSTIEKIVEDIEIEKLKNIYIQYKDIYDIVSKYIIRKKLLLYGGLTINLLLPQKYKFYKDYTLNDYDCYSKTAMEDSIELAHILKSKGYKYVKVRLAKHKETYRVYVNNKQVMDITKIDNILYKKLYDYSNKELPIHKYYNESYKIIPTTMIKRNFHYELSRPEQSSYRWVKIYNRMKLFNEVYKNKKSKIIAHCVPIDKEYQILTKKLLNYIKSNDYPIIDSYALKFYLKTKKTCCYRTSESSTVLVILSDNYEKTKNEVISQIEIILDMNKYEIVINHNDNDIYILPSKYDISILNKNNNKIFKILDIILTKNECFSMQKISGYTVGSIDTILYFLYCNYILNDIYNKNTDEILYIINTYEEYINNVLKSNIKKRLKSTCYGNINNEDEFKVNWKKRLTIKYV